MEEKFPFDLRSDLSELAIQNDINNSKITGMITVNNTWKQ
jgi:hypothetical protein